MAKIKNTDNIKQWWGREQLELLHVAGWRAKLYSPSAKRLDGFFWNQALLTIWSSSITPRCLPKRNENLCPYKTCTQISVTALLNCGTSIQWYTTQQKDQIICTHKLDKTHRNKLYTMTLFYDIKKKIIVTKKRLVITRSWNEKKVWHKGIVTGVLGGDRNVKCIKESISLYS